MYDLTWIFIELGTTEKTTLTKKTNAKADVVKIRLHQPMFLFFQILLKLSEIQAIPLFQILQNTNDSLADIKLVRAEFVFHICNGFGRNIAGIIKISIDITSYLTIFSLRIWNVDWISKATAFNIIPAVIGVWIITLPADDIFQFGNQFT